MSEGYVKSTTENKVTTIEFFHPKSNSLPATLLKQLAEQVEEAGREPDSKVVVIRSAGEKAFCAGASFSELLAIENEEQGLRFFMGFANVINAMRICPKLIIGRIQGSCVGGGVGIAAAVDYAFATHAAKIKLSELAVGIGPFVVAPAIERKMGLSALSQLAVDAKGWRNAEWAAQNGLFANLYDTAEEMDAAIAQLSADLADSNPEAMRGLKQVFWRGTDEWEELLSERAKISGKLVLSEFTRTAIEKFKAG